ncbi:protein kinase [Archangium violaceum]|uniref:serine/threonine protein kinase n=1 Tax=Archangium violaceum TaxID=83451 RepID=UPI002B2F4C09|nr:protein kinase [Archangium violaceum]
MASPPPAAVAFAGRMLRILLVIGFILEVGAALETYAQANTVERFSNEMQAQGVIMGSANGIHHLPAGTRVFIWTCIAVALLVWRMLRGGLSELPGAQQEEEVWLRLLHRTWFGTTLIVIPTEALFIGFNLLVQPGLTVLGLKLEFWLCVGLAATFFLSVVLLEQEKPALAPAALPEPSPQREPAAAPLQAQAPAPEAVPSASPGSNAYRGTCAVCTQPVQGPRCSSCGAAVIAGGFRVVGLLAQSAHARTYLAHAPNGTKAVLKEMSFALAPDESSVQAFEREGALLQQLQHSRLPRFIASFTEGSGAGARFYLAYVYVEGLSLAQELQRHRYSEAEAIELTRSVLRILVYLHALSPPIIHRDIKPANLLRQSNGAIVLVDFGAARDLSRTTQQATMVGTFGYMPREQLGGQVDATSDLYALGTTVLHLLTRKAPWEMLDETGQLVFPRQLNVSPDFRRILQRLTAARRKDRFPSAREALRALDAPPRGTQLRRWAVAAAGVLLLSAGGAVVYVRSRGESLPARASEPRAATASPTPRTPPAPRAPTPKTPPPTSAAASIVLARFDGGEVTEEELRERTARLPPRLRGRDSSTLRQWRVRTLVTEKLLEQEAARVVTDPSAWSLLPDAVQRRLRVRALLDAQVPADTEPDLLPQVRMSAISELGNKLYRSAHVELDLERLKEVELSSVAIHWQAWELQAAREALREPERRLRFQHGDPTAEPCSGRVTPSAAAYDARCGCEALPDQLLEEDVLYFDLYLSEEGPNVLFTHNFTGTACRELFLTNGSPANVEQKLAQQTGFRVELNPRVLHAPTGSRPEDLQRILRAMSPRLGECIHARSVESHFEGNLGLEWVLEEGLVRDLKLADEGSGHEGSLKGTPVEDCLRQLLDSWRMVGFADEGVSVDFEVTATREAVDVQIAE